jgi:hypothetical protein
MDQPVRLAEDVLRSIAELTSRERVLIRAQAVAEGDVSDVPGEADKLRALLDAVGALEAAGAPYALCGGVAVGLRTGVPRATLDVDLAVDSASRGPSLVERLVDAGFRLVGEHAHSVNFRHSSGEPVQLVFDRAFDDMVARGEPVAVGGREVRVVTHGDLVAMKRLSAADPARRRSKALRDQADLALLLGDVPDPDEGW